MKTAKLALKIILAFTLPLNAMALGSAGEARKVLSMEERIEVQTLKLKKVRLQESLAESSVTIQVLEDIADSGLLASYRKHREVIIGSTLGATMVSTFVVAMVEVFSKKIDKTIINRVGYTALFGGLLATVSQIAIGVMDSDGYGLIRDRISHLSIEEQKQIYTVALQKLITDAQQLEILENQLQVLEK